MATPTIPNGETQFFVSTYTGNGGGQRVGKFVPFTDSGTIANSLIFNRADNPRLARTPSSAGNRKTWTFSVWIKRVALGSARNLILTTSPSGGTAGEFLMFHTDNTIKFTDATSSYYNLITNRTFEDTSKFYHLLIAVDTTQATASNRIKMYIDGNQITSFSTETYPSQNFQFEVNNTSNPMNLGGDYGSSGSENASYYFAEVNIVDGTALTPSTFGVTDTSSGRWIPKTLSGITYGTNGFRLQFASSSNLGDDTSGNTNDFSVSNLVAGDKTTDSPTQNHATLAVNGPNISSTFSEGNLKVTLPTSSAMTGGLSTLKMVSGKYYMEATIDSISSAGVMLGIMGSDRYASTAEYAGKLSDSYGYYSVNGNITNNSVSVSFGNTYTTSDIIGIAVDLDNDKLYFSKNGTFQNSANPSAGTGGQSIISAKSTTAGFYRFSLTDAGTGSTDIVTANFGQKSFTYTPPTGFVALQQDNLPTTDKGVSGFVWMKVRDADGSHHSNDSSNGVFNRLVPNLTNALAFRDGSLSKFLKGGQAIGDNTAINNSGNSYVSWNWVANGGTTASNTDGSITSTVQANTTAGFSIVEYTGTGSSGSIGHGLSAAPEVIWIKDKGNSTNWRCWHTGFGNITTYQKLNSDDGYGTASMWGTPTSDAFIVGGTGYEVNESSNNYVAYCWHSVDGFSAFGRYSGNNNADGPYIQTGFKPSLLIIKGYTIGNNWIMWDNKRSVFNPCDNVLYPDLTQAEATSGNDLDFLSNGFKCRGTNSNYNGSYDYLYWCWAEHPFLGDGVSPVTAR